MSTAPRTTAQANHCKGSRVSPKRIMLSSTPNTGMVFASEEKRGTGTLARAYAEQAWAPKVTQSPR